MLPFIRLLSMSGTYWVWECCLSCSQILTLWQLWGLRDFNRQTLACDHWITLTSAVAYCPQWVPVFYSMQKLDILPIDIDYVEAVVGVIFYCIVNVDGILWVFWVENIKEDTLFDVGNHKCELLDNVLASWTRSWVAFKFVKSVNCYSFIRYPVCGAVMYKFEASLIIKSQRLAVTL